MSEKIQQNDLVFLALGSNLGNRMENLRTAIDKLSEFFSIKKMSHVIETKALLLEGSPNSWNIPYMNMIIAGTTNLSADALLSEVKKIEQKLGRNLDAEKWSPRIIDIDIISYYGQKITKEYLTIPHKEIKNRDFLQYLLAEIGYKIPIDIQSNIENYSALGHFVLFPKMVGIVNVTPDSFSDGGHFLDPEKAEKQIRKLISDGATMVDIGGQSTRPGYKEISANEEISRLSKVLEFCSDVDCISIDTFSDDVVSYVINNHPKIKCINVQQQKLQDNTIKLIADHNLKMIIMLTGMDFSFFRRTIAKLEKLGIQQKNIIVDPGIGFGKSKQENVETIKNLNRLRETDCEIMLAHSRKSFISAFSNAKAEDRDIETIAISSFAFDNSAVDYIRVHNVEKHMRFFVAKKLMNKELS